MTVPRMDNVGFVVDDDMQAAIAFFVELGLDLEGEGTVAGPWLDRTIGLDGARCDTAMLRSPDGYGRLELSRFHPPPVVSTQPASAPVNTYEDAYLLGYVRGPEGIIVRLAQQLGETG
ncbi:MAG: VOC family protein [Chloroflexota bacterium]